MKRFNARPQCRARTQRAMMRLLRASPMPWTYGMIVDWFGHASISKQIGEARMAGRLKRVARGLYTVRPMVE